jgi:hypothetical protein
MVSDGFVGATLPCPASRAAERLAEQINAE